MATFLLVHGGLHGGWCWETIVPLLEADGHRVIAPDLPGVKGEVPAAEVTLQAYADAQLALARDAGEPVIAVPHSLGGRSVSLAAEQQPELFRALIYVTALVPEIAGSPPSFIPAEDNIIGSGFYPVAGGAAVMSSEASARAGFYSDCPEPAIAAAFARLVPQPLGPMADPVELTAERWGSVPRHYVLTLNDMTIPLAGQRAMATAHPGAVLHELPSGHSPFITHPRQLADILEAVAAAA
jgi:pimeloyl-ACP methyl ester carboxylesterase